MKLATVRIETGGTTAVLINGDEAFVLNGLLDVQGFLELTDSARAEAIESAQENAAWSVADLDYAPLVLNPAKVLCIGLNYRNHVTEVGMEAPKHPSIFAKFAASLTGANDSVEIPPEDHRLDYEGELAVIIGRRGRRISVEDADAIIGGYAVSNDISVRGYQGRTTQWLQGKAWDASTPVGPWLVTPEDFTPGARITTRVNGELVQDDSTDDLVFSVPELISYISAFTELKPGDVILTGTPAGVALSRRNDEGRRPWLTADDTVETSIESLGTSTLTFHNREGSD